MYVEIDVIMLGKEDMEMPATIPRESISYYRGYITEKDEGLDKPIVMIWLVGSNKPVRILSTLDAFKRKCCAKHLNVDGLSNEKIDNLKEHIEKLREN